MSARTILSGTDPSARAQGEGLPAMVTSPRPHGDGESAGASDPAELARCVVAWQRHAGRHDLPWQRTRDPYRVWLSEIMLQQTQVATVIGYYERFLTRFPDVAALAAAAPDEVLAAWSGLGYYRRARLLHHCAQEVMQRFGGRFPGHAAALATLPGIGRSTAAAIAAFCFGQRVAILDGNVKRVLSRALGFEGDLARAAQERALWALAEALVPARGVEAYTQGLMDLGARVCTARRPDCGACPLAATCIARAQGRPQAYPVKTRRARRQRRASELLWLIHRGRVWLVPRPGEGVWAGLWCLPERPAATPRDPPSETDPVMDPAMASDPGSPAPAPDAPDAPDAGPWPDAGGWPGEGGWRVAVEHVLTHLDWRLRPLRWTLPDETDPARLAAIARRWPEGRWFTPAQAAALGLPAPVRRWLEGPDVDARSPRPPSRPGRP